MRLNPVTPARQYFKEALRPAKRKPGRLPTTGITTIIQKDLSRRDIYINLRGINAIKEESRCAMTVRDGKQDAACGEPARRHH